MEGQGSKGVWGREDVGEEREMIREEAKERDSATM